MYDDLISRPQACDLFKMSRSTFMTYSAHYPAFPAVRGIDGRFYQYSEAELMHFFEQHAPKYAAKAKARAES